MAIQMISRTRQIMLTKMPRAAERPSAAMETTKPPSCTPSCMGRNPRRLAKRVVSERIRIECRKVRVIPVKPPPQSTPKSRSMKRISKAWTIRARYSRARLL